MSVLYLNNSAMIAIQPSRKIIGKNKKQFVAGPSQRAKQIFLTYNIIVQK